MVNKKHLLLVGLCTALGAQPVFAQESQSTTPQGSAQWSARDMTYRGQNYDVLDTAFIPKKSMAQHKKFLNHQYAYPARPRNMWEVGIGINQPYVIGSIPALLFFQKGGYGFNASVRKSWGYLFSTRLQYIYSVAKGLDTRGTSFFNSQTQWVGNGYVPNLYVPNFVYPNYKMFAQSINLDMMINSNNIKFNRARTSLSLYAFLGLGAMNFRTYTNVGYNYNGGPSALQADFNNIHATVSGKNNIRKAVQKDLGSDDKDVATNPGGNTNFAPSVGAGAQFRINKRVNIQIEERLSYPTDFSYMDGMRYTLTNQVAANTNGTYTAVNIPTRGEFLSNTSVGVNFNLGNKKRRVEPLYWLNPLDYTYNELNYPRHMLLPDPVLPDADGDGVTDQFDKCPGTPAGVSVDSHGCPLDTDGDGVPDFRDKQLITPTECQPVDADGVGKCPCPEGCGTGNKGSQCGNIGAGSIIFPATSAKISSAMQAQLATLAAQMQANPDCHVVITGAGNGNKLQQQRSWDRVNSVIQYMSEKNGINRNRFIFQYGQSGDANVVMYRSANVGEEGPVNVPPPFPNLKTGDK